MATFPESSPAPVHPFEIMPRFRTLVSELDSGNEQRRSKQEFPVYDVSAKYDKALDKLSMDTLYAFYLARKGRYEGFYIYDLADVHNQTTTIYTDQYVGTGDGTTVTWDIPARSTSSQTLYVNGVEDGTASFLSGGGESNSDRVTPSSVPALGDVLSVDFTGILRMYVRFELDKGLTRQLFEQVLYRAGTLKFFGLRAGS